MCKLYSCILTKTYNVLDSCESDNHTDTIEEHGLKDDKINQFRNWLRCELIPIGDSIESCSPEDWKFVLDEEVKPYWYDEEKAERSCKQRLFSLIKKGRYSGAWKGHVYLSGCTGLKALPDGFNPKGDVDLSGCTGLNKN